MSETKLQSSKQGTLHSDLISFHRLLMRALYAATLACHIATPWVSDKDSMRLS